MAFYHGLAICLAIQAMAMLTPGQNHLLLLSIPSYDIVRRAQVVLGIASAGLVFASGVVFSMWLGGEAMSTRLFAILNLLGSSYLIFLGVRLLLETVGRRPTGKRADDDASGSDEEIACTAIGLAPFLSGFLINISNPKSALFFASVFSATIPVAKAGALDLVVAIFAFFVNSLVFHGAVAAFFGGLWVRRILARWTLGVNIAAGLIFLTVGVIFGVAAFGKLAA